MAAARPRPGRTLVLFVLALVLMYVGLALNGVWSPKLGLDLQGGTRITLTASTETGEAITPEKMNEAVTIVDNRVNASGVAESEVSLQGDDQIVVEIPGQDRKDLVNTVKQQAQLRFRLVGASAPDQEPAPAPSPSPSAASPSKAPQGSPKPSVTASTTSSPAGRAAALAPSPTPKPGSNASSQPSPKPSAKPTAQPSAQPAAAVPTNKSSVAEQLAWMRNPDPASLAAFQKFRCSDEPPVDDPSKPLLACDDQGNKFLLGPAIIEGTQLNDADYGIPPNEAKYAVDLSFDGSATDDFAEITRSMAGKSTELFAIVLDGEVLSAPTVNTPITNGKPQISGSFTAGEAKSLANSLKYGALPLKFDVPLETVEGPTLAADQLQAGLLAGGIGLALVLIYCLIYYRALGLVVVASLGMAGALTYAAVIFLSEQAGFTLTLPGIAGLIVAVGITADSFIVYFERLRDELRDGKTLRVAVEAAWVRARATCLAADAVSLLAALVLYIFAIGVVKGFAFALGISTLIDLVVFFWFTKPMVTWLARFPLFRDGHKLSGLQADHIGSPRAPLRTATGGAR